MIIDTLDRLPLYGALHPLIAQVCDFLKEHNLEDLPVGRTIFDEDLFFVNIDLVEPKTCQEAILETHRDMIDIQIPLTGEETHGYAPSNTLPAKDYDAQRDCTLYPIDYVQTFFILQPGQFVIYLPGEGHAPAISTQPLRKAIFKLRNKHLNLP